MPFARLDNAAVARSLSQIADRPGDLADVFFERREEIELPPDDDAPGIRVWREEGLAARLLRNGRSWLAGRDGVDRDSFHDALRRAARALPRASYPLPELAVDPWGGPPRAPELLEFPPAVQRAVRSHHVAFPLRLTVRRHRRWLRTIGTQLSSGVEAESFYSYRAETPWTRTGGLLTELDDPAAEQVALGVMRAYRGREAEAPKPGRAVVVLGASATAVLLHEAVAHALEADTLALGGHPEAAVGVRMGSELLNVFDDPGTAPDGVRRTADDEGYPVSRRCLLRRGVVEQPLCDAAWARASESFTAGAGRRGDRHHPPGPRSSHLVLAPGELAAAEILDGADGGLYLSEVERGRLDPLSGELTLRFAGGRRIENGVPGPPVGPCSLRGRLRDLLDKVIGVGREVHAAGAGWCAKGGVKMAVWATAPELRFDGVEIAP